jgi:hypothetical protein
MLLMADLFEHSATEKCEQVSADTQLVSNSSSTVWGSMSYLSGWPAVQPSWALGTAATMQLPS